MSGDWILDSRPWGVAEMKVGGRIKVVDAPDAWHCENGKVENVTCTLEQPPAATRPWLSISGWNDHNDGG